VPARAATDTRVFPAHLTPGVNRGYQKGVLKEGRLANFTGACSPLVYEGGAIDGLRGHAIVCEVAGNLVHRYRLEERDGRVVATPADGERSFWTSTDERFRPVATATGPDGMVYVADMYRGVIQHRNFMTTFLRRQVDARGLAQPVDAGRIWRVVPAGSTHASAGEPAPNLTTLDSARLIEFLAVGNKSLRETARRIIVERSDRSIADALRSRLRESLAAEIILEHLWALAGIESLDASTIDVLASHPDPIVRVHLLRAVERTQPPADLAALLARLAGDSALGVRMQAVLSSGALDPVVRVAVLEGGLRRDLASREMRSAVLSSATGAEGLLLEMIADGSVLDSDSVAARAFASEFTDLVLDDGSGRPTPTTLFTALGTVARVSAERPWLARSMVERIAARQRLNAKEPVQLVASQEPSGWLIMLDRNDPALQLAASVDRHIFWPGREDVSFVPPKIAKAASMTFEEFGKRLYSNCMSCHQANGRGLPPVYPPLRGSSIVHGDPEILAKILLHGLEGKIEVDGQTYNQVMPAAPIRADDEIAAVLSYVRSAWGNSAPAVDPALVAKIREETKGRNRPFTAKELGIGAD
jgi:mono/diheme cytochrome c family protein